MKHTHIGRAILYLSLLIVLLSPSLHAESISDNIVSYTPKHIIVNNMTENISAEEIIYKESLVQPEPEAQSLKEEFISTVEDHPIIVGVIGVGGTITSLLFILEL